MTTPRSQNIDADMCKRVKSSFKRLGMTYAALAIDSGVASKAQLIDTANGKIEPSKRIIKYLCLKGFNAHWIFTGKGTELWNDKTTEAGSVKIAAIIKKDIARATLALNTCAAQISELQKVLKVLQH